MELPLGGFPSIGKVPTLPSVNDGANWLADTATAVADRLGLPHNRLFDEWASTLDPSRWPEPPEGDGRPAMLIPGFLAGDPSLSNMARWLKRGDWNMTRSGINWNVNCTQATIEGVEARLRASVEASGKRALLVGQSRGGAMGKVIAVRNPDLVETLVTLGSPLNDHFNIHPRTWFGIGIIGGMLASTLVASLFVPLFFVLLEEASLLLRGKKGVRQRERSLIGTMTHRARMPRGWFPESRPLGTAFVRRWKP